MHPPKKIRDITLVEMLEKIFESVPITQRGRVAIEFKQSEELLTRNLENIYNLATQRLLHLSYYLEWARSIAYTPPQKPMPFTMEEFDYLPACFNDLDTMTSEHTAFLNSSFSNWVYNQAIRELSEFLQTYLSELYETCLVLERTKTPITPKDTLEIKKYFIDFERAGLKARLKTLRQNFGFTLKHHQEILSLHEVRNIFSHHDGIVTKDSCNKDGYLEVIWPKNSYKLKKRGKNEWVPFHRVPKPFSSDEYESFQVTWLSTSEIRKYKPQEHISLCYKDLNTLLSFYLFVFNELHNRLVSYVQESGMKVKEFAKYKIVLEGISFTSDNGTIEAAV